MDNEEVFQDTQPDEVAPDQDFQQEETWEPVYEVAPEVDPAELEQKNRELYARAKKAEEELKRLKSQEPKQPINDSSQFATKADLERFTLSQKYDEEVVEEIMRLGGKQVLENPLVKEGIEARQAKKRSEAATPADSGRSPLYKKHTKAELDAMPLDEMEKLLRSAQ